MENPEQRENMYSSPSQKVYSQVENGGYDTINYKGSRIVEEPEGKKKAMEINRERNSALRYIKGLH